MEDTLSFLFLCFTFLALMSNHLIVNVLIGTTN